MRIGCLQFAPQVGDVNNNMNRADSVLSRANPDIDLLVLPELAFTGYNFSSFDKINPYLEPTASGVTSLWARTTALRYKCVVAVGYPEKAETENWKYYNSAIIASKTGETVVNYRKTFLYPRDEAWALEGHAGFFDGTIPGIGYAAMGIGMDIKFEAPWNVWEFANFVLHRQPNLVILSMAWITHQEYSNYSRKPTSPDLAALSYWVARFEPLIRAEDQGEVIVVITNRTGCEGNAVYAGTSCVIGIQDGEVKVYGILGRGQKELLVVDTANPPQFKLVAETDTPIHEDRAQSREYLKLDSGESEQADTVPDTPYPTDEAQPLGLEAAFAEIRAVSPIGPLSSHAFFGNRSPSKRRASIISTESSFTPIGSNLSSPSKRRGSITSSESTFTPIGSNLSSPVSNLGQPRSPDSTRDGRSPSEPSPISQEQLERMLHIASVFDRQSEPRSAWSPDSASTSASTDWDYSPSSSTTTEQFINIIPPSPVVGFDNDSRHFNFSTTLSPFPRRNTSLRPLSHSSTSMNLPPRGRRTSSPSNLSRMSTADSDVSISSEQKIPSRSPAPTLKAPQLPRSRNTSRTRAVEREATATSPEIGPEIPSIPLNPEVIHNTVNNTNDDNMTGIVATNDNMNTNSTTTTNMITTTNTITSNSPDSYSPKPQDPRKSITIQTARTALIIPGAKIHHRQLSGKPATPPDDCMSPKPSIGLHSTVANHHKFFARGRTLGPKVPLGLHIPRARSVSPPPTPVTALWMEAGAGFWDGINVGAGAGAGGMGVGVGVGGPDMMMSRRQGRIW